jgi:hypothetical protein
VKCLENTPPCDEALTTVMICPMVMTWQMPRQLMNLTCYLKKIKIQKPQLSPKPIYCVINSKVLTLIKKKENFFNIKKNRKQ